MTISPSIDRLIAWHDRCASKTRIILLLAIYPLFPAVLLPWIGDVGGAPILDLHPYYNTDIVRQVLLQYDASALQNYRLCALTVDMIYPVYYAFLISLLFASLLKRRPTDSKALHLLRLLPFLVMIVDWTENLTLVAIVDQWPALDHDLANTAGLITSTKWALLAVIVMSLIALAVNNKRAVNPTAK